MKRGRANWTGALRVGLRLGAAWAVLASRGIDCRAAAPARSAHADMPDVQERSIREIPDPAGGVVWRLIRDKQHPQGPGHLVRVMRGSDGPSRDSELEQSTTMPVPLPPSRKIIRAGDHLVVEETTAVVEMRLSAVALEPASAGQVIEARLDADRKRVRVIALAPGRAQLAAISQVQP